MSRTGHRAKGELVFSRSARRASGGARRREMGQNSKLKERDRERLYNVKVMEVRLEL